MDRESVLTFLIALLGSFYYDPALPSELADILAKSGREDAFRKLLMVRIRQLLAQGINAVKLEEFENIGSGLFSMHFASKGFNIRILFSFLSSGEPALLSAFYERGGKKHTDYTNNVPVALARLKTIKEGLHHEP